MIYAFLKRHPLQYLGSGTFLFFTLPVWHMYRSFQLEWHDTGHLYQMLRNVFEMGFFYSPDWKMDHFNVHFTPFFYLWALVARMGLIPFLLLGAASLAASAMVIYQLVYIKTKSSRLAWILSLLFVGNPYVASLNLYPHFESYGLFFLLLFSLLVTQKRWKSATLAFLLALTVREDFWIYGILVCFSTWENRTRGAFLFWIILALLYKILVLSGLWPMWFPHATSRMYDLWHYGKSPSEFHILLQMIQQWRVTGPALWHGASLAFLLSFAFIPLLAGWRIIPLLAVLFLWVNSTEINRASLAYYYSCAPLLILATLLPYAAKRFLLWKERISLPVRPQWVIGFLLCVVAIGQALPPRGLRISPSLRRVLHHPTTPRDHAVFQVIHTWFDHNQASVFTQFALGTYIPYRKELYITHTEAHSFLGGRISPHFVFLDLKRENPHADKIPLQRLVDHLEKNPVYLKRVEQDGVFLYEKRE